MPVIMSNAIIKEMGKALREANLGTHIREQGREIAFGTVVFRAKDWQQPFDQPAGQHEPFRPPQMDEAGPVENISGGPVKPQLQPGSFKSGDRPGDQLERVKPGDTRSPGGTHTANFGKRAEGGPTPPGPRKTELESGITAGNRVAAGGNPSPEVQPPDGMKKPVEPPAESGLHKTAPFERTGSRPTDPDFKPVDKTTKVGA